MGTRRELRLQLALPVRVWGTDIDGKSFAQDATTVDLTTTGVQLEGVLQRIQRGSIVFIQHRGSKAAFYVRWIGRMGAESQGHVGLKLLEGEKFNWGRTIPCIPGDAFVKEEIEEYLEFKVLD
jgi:hypothetical protein